MTFLILDGANLYAWARHHGGGLLIPEKKRPSVLQPDRKAGELEALRLSRENAGGLFVLFGPVAIAKRMPETTHVNLRGEPVRHANVSRLVMIDGGAWDSGDEVPF